MGWSRQYYSPQELGWKTRRANAERRAEEAAVEAKRMALADKIVTAVVDRIAADIIRPGPKPEERECYIMAQELRDHSDHLKTLVSAVLAVEAEEGDDAES